MFEGGEETDRHRKKLHYVKSEPNKKRMFSPLQLRKQSGEAGGLCVPGDIKTKQFRNNAPQGDPKLQTLLYTVLS